MEKKIDKNNLTILMVGDKDVKLPYESNFGIDGHSPIYPTHTTYVRQGGELIEGNADSKKNYKIVTVNNINIWRGGRWLYLREKCEHPNGKDVRTIFVRNEDDFHAACKWAKNIVSFERGLDMPRYGGIYYKENYVLWEKEEKGLHTRVIKYYYKNGEIETQTESFHYNGTFEELKEGEADTILWYEILCHKKRKGKVEKFSINLNGEHLGTFKIKKEVIEKIEE